MGILEIISDEKKREEENLEFFTDGKRIFYETKCKFNKYNRFPEIKQTEGSFRVKLNTQKVYKLFSKFQTSSTDTTNLKKALKKINKFTNKDVNFLHYLRRSEIKKLTQIACFDKVVAQRFYELGLDYNFTVLAAAQNCNISNIIPYLRKYSIRGTDGIKFISLNDTFLYVRTIEECKTLIEFGIRPCYESSDYFIKNNEWKILNYLLECGIIGLTTQQIQELRNNQEYKIQFKKLECLQNFSSLSDEQIKFIQNKKTKKIVDNIESKQIIQDDKTNAEKQVDEVFNKVMREFEEKQQ